jgi:hypothetical protein
MPHVFRGVLGSTNVSNIRHVDGRHASTDSLFESHGLNIGIYEPGEQAIVTFALNPDFSMLSSGQHCIPISVSARTVQRDECGELSWSSGFVKSAAIVNVRI